MAGGRPTSYQPEFAEQAQKLCELGATDADLADFFGVSVRTVYRWMNTEEKFCHTVKTGKEVADTRVERSLYQRAIGYTLEIEKAFLPKGASQPVYAVAEEHVPADTTAAIFWLKNRKRKEWRDTKFLAGDDELPLRIETTRKIDVTGLTVEQLEALEAAMTQTILMIEHEKGDANDGDA